MDAMRIIQDYEKPAYMSIKEAAQLYGYSKQTVYNLIKEMKECSRYKGAWLELNQYGDKLINTLALEDFLRYRAQLKEPALARNLPPYDPREVRKQRGEVSVITNYVDDEQVRDHVREFMAEWIREKLG